MYIPNPCWVQSLLWCRYLHERKKMLLNQFNIDKSLFFKTNWYFLHQNNNFKQVHVHIFVSHKEHASCKWQGTSAIGSALSATLKFALQVELKHSLLVCRWIRIKVLCCTFFYTIYNASQYRFSKTTVINLIFYSQNRY